MFANQPANISDLQSDSHNKKQIHDTSWGSYFQPTPSDDITGTPYHYLASTSSFGKSGEISLDSLDRLVGTGSDFTSVPKRTKNENVKHSRNDDSPVKCSCKDAMEHIDNCDKCNGRLKSMIKNAVSKTMDDALLDHKLKTLNQPIQPIIQPFQQIQPYQFASVPQIQTAPAPVPSPPPPKVTSEAKPKSKKTEQKGYSSKDVMLIVFAILIIVLLLFLVFYKR
jgi:hypothetical protein